MYLVDEGSGKNKKRASSEKTLRDSLKSPELLINNSD